MFGGKPIIGLVGGIGSGKSFVARLFSELGCIVIDSDAQVRDAYRDPKVLDQLRSWWGEEIILPDGYVNRPAIAAKIFANPAEKTRLEQLIHPIVHAARERAMTDAKKNSQVVGFVWDTPLLLEAGLGPSCDAIVFVDAPLEQRLTRVKYRSNWDREELLRREKLQVPLDRKRALADYVLTNAADAGSGTSALADLREQVRRVLSQILARSSQTQR